ncbi:hypothetical protein SAMN04490178_13827, partial [Propionispora vibrioides]
SKCCYEEPDALIGQVRFREGGWNVSSASTRLRTLRNNFDKYLMAQQNRPWEYFE